LIGSLLVLVPFLTALIWAVVLGFCLWPVHMRLTRRLGNRRTLSALLMTLMIALVLVVPFLVIGMNVPSDTRELRAVLRRWVENADHSPPAWLTRLPVIGHQAGAYWTEVSTEGADMLRKLREPPTTEPSTTEPATLPAATTMPVSPVVTQTKLIQYLRSLLASLRSSIFSASLAIGQGVLQVALSVFLTFFIFRDGAVMAHRIETGMTRIAGQRGARLLGVAGGTVRGVVYGILGTALVQGVMAGIGFLIAGVPGAALLGLLTFFLSPLPIGPPLIWIPATVWLFSQGDSGWGTFMLIWGIGISSVDNIVKPLIIKQGADLPFILVFIGVLGGALAFGFIGVFLGPTLLAVVYRLVDEWSADIAPGAGSAGKV
jgi:predicted PurR-regulated permease PerM